VRPAELQPPAVQALNVQNQQQAQVTGPQAAQQAFAAQMEKTASERPSQVQAPQPGDPARPARVLGEDQGEKPRRRPRRGAGREAAPREEEGGEVPPAMPGSRLDLLV
jgi:hypothetical protein